MDEGEAIFARIVAEPDEDLHRYAYADWLAEHEQPQWAEFIWDQLRSGIGCTVGLAGYPDWKYPLDASLQNYAPGLVIRSGGAALRLAEC